MCIKFKESFHVVIVVGDDSFKNDVSAVKATLEEMQHIKGTYGGWKSERNWNKVWQMYGWILDLFSEGLHAPQNWGKIE